VPFEAPPQPAVTTAAPPRNHTLTVRLWCGFTFFVCAAMLTIGRFLTPSAEGLGTHQQLGMLPCGSMKAFGIPCPTCGCTTAVSHVAHFNFVSAFLTQPFGAVLGLFAGAAGALALFGLISGKWIGPSMFWFQWHWKKWVFGGLGLLALGWGYKIVLVLMAGTAK